MRFAISLTTLVATVMLASAPLSAQKLVPLPTRFVSDRFFVTPVTTRGDTLVLFTDSGGGGPWVIKPVLDRLGASAKFVGVEDGDSIFSGGKFPTFKPSASVPNALGQPDGSLFALGNKAMPQLEGAVGMLGQKWFAGRVWVVDYPGKQLSVYDTPPVPIPFGAHTIPMTLKKPPQASHPRIQVLVDGDTIDMLLDTGWFAMRTNEPYDNMMKALMDKPILASLGGNAFHAFRLTMDYPNQRVTFER